MPGLTRAVAIFLAHSLAERGSFWNLSMAGASWSMVFSAPISLAFTFNRTGNNFLETVDRAVEAAHGVGPLSP